MVESIEGLAENVVGFRGVGRITSEDYEKVLIPAVEAKLAEGQKVRLLYCLGEDFEGFDAGAMWDDAKVGLRHITSWERIAFVTDVEWLRETVKIFGFVMPGQVRVFKNSELSEAKEWVSE